MPYPKTNPTLYENLLHIDLWNLRKQGLIETRQKRKTTSITWRSENGAKLMEVFIKIVTINTPHVELNYEYYSERIKQKIFLVTLRYGVGNGRHWYFLCPSTGNRCRKLYLVHGQFVSRNAFKGMYEIQTRSRKTRSDIRRFQDATQGERAHVQMRKKYFKSHYAGKPTKKYLVLKEQIRQSENVSKADIELLYIS